MIFHLGFDLPEPAPRNLDHESSELTCEEIRILKEQIAKNTRLVSDYVARLDLLVNKERYPKGAAFIKKIRSRLEVLMEENDTFRKVLWTYYQAQDIGSDSDLD